MVSPSIMYCTAWRLVLLALSQKIMQFMTSLALAHLHSDFQKCCFMNTHTHAADLHIVLWTNKITGMCMSVDLNKPSHLCLKPHPTCVLWFSIHYSLCIRHHPLVTFMFLRSGVNFLKRDCIFIVWAFWDANRNSHVNKKPNAPCIKTCKKRKSCLQTPLIYRFDSFPFIHTSQSMAHLKRQDKGMKTTRW